ncbi:hypothetical protein FZEAL_5103 [Fusarium zealandicum]|uniref:Protein kinase domain-containing protein n=1 Tax=Fusarium zealandicum TaxID=1053134 RepID=A0A8H4XK64_9HYPO|nr:hypothetical protein FZEAL_5103 [Fusarium zealandicum]
MGDPLSTIASVIAVLQVAAKATQYLKDVKHGSTDRLRLRDELRSTTCLLEMIKDRMEDSDEMVGSENTLRPMSIQTMAGTDGPLNLFRRVLEDIIAKLAPQDSLGRMAKPFTWPFDKNDVSELLACLERLKSHFSLVMQNDLMELAKLTNLKLDELDDRAERAEAKSRDDETQKIILWTSPISFRAKHVDVLESVQSGTGAWLLSHETFRSWVNGDISILWCPGIPGAGKTSLVSLVVDHLERERVANTTCTYVYCDHNQRQEQSPSVLLSSILQQVLQNSTERILPSEVSLLYRQHQKYDTRPTMAQIVDVLRKLASRLSIFYVVIDALDECAESEEDAVQFMSTVCSLGSHVKVLCTSRFSTTFEDYFDQSMKLQISAQSEDIEMFLDTQIPLKYRLSRHIRTDPALRGEIIRAITQESQGMFLLAKLHLESLSQKINRKEVRSSLQTLPSTLDATYSDALERIYRQSPDAVELAEAVLFWVVCVKRPLTVLELQQMYATQQLPEETLLEEDDLPDGDILIGACGGLVSIDVESKTVRLVHYTAQQYFERSHVEKLLNAKMDITMISLKYLVLPNFSAGVCTTDKDMAQRLEQYPFLDYAAKNWGSDISKLNENELFSALDSLVSNGTAVEAASQVFSIGSVRYSNWSQEYPRGIPALVHAAVFDLPVVLGRMVKSSHSIDDKGSDGETALIRSASFGHLGNVRVLLDLGADQNARDHMDETALQRAARNGEKAVVEALLEKGADVNLKGSGDWTALMSAVSSGNAQVVEMLVDAGAELQAETVWGDSALSLATRSGQEAIATFLADRGAVLPRNAAGRRASTVASRRGFSVLVKRLTANYEPVANRRLQRQRSRVMGGLDGIDETLELAATEGDAVETGQGDFSEVMENLEYKTGFSRRYDLKELIGKGNYAEVYLCTNKVTSTAYAVKIFKVSSWKGVGTKLGGMHNELKILRQVQEKPHANILRLFDFSAEYSHGKMYMVIELAAGGELFDYIVMKNHLSEHDTRLVMLQLFSALDYLVGSSSLGIQLERPDVKQHDLGWIHRDIKLENILLADGESLNLKVADFGLCKKIGTEPESLKLATTLCGTPSFVAPEVLAPRETREYGFAVDVWSAGVVLYICLCGFPPFSDELHTPEYPFSQADQIKGGMFDYPSPYWDPVGDPALDLIEDMLTVEVKKRFTIKQCINHPWILDKNSAVLLDADRSASPEPM